MEAELKTWKVISYVELDCDITEGHWIGENSCDTYIEYSLEEDDELSSEIISVYSNVQIGETVLIHLDW